MAHHLYEADASDISSMAEGSLLAQRQAQSYRGIPQVLRPDRVNEPLRIVHLNTYDISGGAALAAYRLHKGLRQVGHDSLMFVAYRESQDPSVRTFAPPMDLVSRIRRRVREQWLIRSFSRYQPTRPPGYERFSDDRTLSEAALPALLPPCDAINLHWIAAFLDFEAFFATLSPRIPIFWTLHDMNAFTGGCHYDHGCGRHTVGCGACPQLGSTDPGDLSHQVWQRKRDTFGRLEPERLHIVALNRWMAEAVNQSPLLGKFPVTVIPNGIDTDAFAPRGTRHARDVLGIPQDAQVVLFVGDVDNRRKGFDLLAQALTGLSRKGNLFFLSVGKGTPLMETEIPRLHLSHIHNDRLLSLVYSAADVFVISSIQDNQPNTVSEAMACGVPVIGFDVGGVPDMVRAGINGLLVPTDVMALRSAILDLLEHPERRREMSTACRRIIMEEYTLETQARRYIDLYERTLQRVALNR